MDLDIYRGGPVFKHIQIDDRTRLAQRAFGENAITLLFESREYYALTIGDYIVHEGIYYYLNTIPNVVKTSTNAFAYEAIFECQYYNLGKVLFQYDSSANFDYIGTLQDYIDLIIAAMNAAASYGTWTRGLCDQTDVSHRQMAFKDETCMAVLQRLCTEFSGEIAFDRTEIQFSDTQGVSTGLTFEYRAGLRGVTRTTVSGRNIVTRLYAFGSEKNINTDYLHPRLVFTNGGNHYLEKNVATYGLIEHSVTFEDIYPHRVGTVATAPTLLTFTDASIDFDVDAQRLSGVVPKVIFQTGDLAGYDFEVGPFTYSAPGGTFTIVEKQIDRQGTTFPNAVIKPAVGDTYIIVDIEMPAAYITAAETALETKAQAYLDANSDPRLVYSVEPDPRWFEANSIELHIGDYITINDTDLGITKLIRVLQLSRSIRNQYDYTLELADDLEPQVSQRLYAGVDEASRKITISNVGDIVRARNGWRTNEELRTMVFDTDGYFDMGNIQPLSVETSMLSVSAKSREFALQAEIAPNLTGDPSKITFSAGNLVHFSVGASPPNTWVLQANPVTGLTAGTAYYIYAKCHKTDYGNANNMLVADSTQRLVEADATYYYFLVGILHSVDAGVRAVSLTYGQTLINGKFITTGRVQSANGFTYLDLDANTLVIASGAGTIAGTNITSIEDGATAGATWGSNVASVPVRLTEGDTPTATGIYITPSFIGFWDQPTTTWTVRIKNDSTGGAHGEFYAGDGSTKYMAWDGTDLTLQGMLRTGTTDSQRVVLDNTDGSLRFFTAANYEGITIDVAEAGGIDYAFLTTRYDVNNYSTITGDGVRATTNIANGGVGVFSVDASAGASGSFVSYRFGINDMFTVGMDGSVFSNVIGANYGVVTGATGKLEASTATKTEINYISGLSSAIQTQLNGKAPTSHAADAATYGYASTDNAGHVRVGTGLGISTGTLNITNPLISAFPAYAGNALKVLRVNAGADAIEWSTPGAGTVTSVTGAAPITSTAGATPEIGITFGATSVTACIGNDGRLIALPITPDDNGKVLVATTGAWVKTAMSTAHGSLGGGTLHADATTDAHGFMTDTQFDKLAGIAENATVGATWSSNITNQPASFTPSAHKASHENGGGDEMSVLNLNGLLADRQTPLAHAVDASIYGYASTAVAGHVKIGTADGLTIVAGTLGLATHSLTGGKHDVAGLTPGTFMKATTGDAFAFAAHGLTYSDVGACATDDARLSDARTPLSHAANASTYGYGDTTNAGHLRVGTGLSVGTGTVAVAYGAGASQSCVGNDARLSDARTPTAHNLIDTTGHAVTGLTNGHFLKATGATTYAFGAHGLTYSSVGAPPEDHASAGSSYGLATNTLYGHCKPDTTSISQSSGTLSTIGVTTTFQIDTGTVTVTKGLITSAP